MTDEERIKDIKSYVGSLLGHKLPYQLAAQYEEDIKWLLEYIEEMELPVSSGRREIEALKAQIRSLEYRVVSANSHTDEIILANMALREKYEPEEEEYRYTPDDTGDDGVDYDLLAESIIKRMKG